jgi:putative ABC transport system substrate-binding protein
MERRTFAGTLVGALIIAGVLDATAKRPDRIYKLGILTLGTDPARSGFWQRFLEAMRELDYVEGRNLIVRRAFADGNEARLPDLVSDLVRTNVDVIVVTSTREALAAKGGSSTIPIVITVALDPVGEGLVASLARPGGNVTGLTSVVPGISQKYVQLLHEFVPSALRFAIVGTPGASSREIGLELQTAAQEAGLTLSFIEIQIPADIDSGLRQAKNDRAGGIIAPLGAVTYRYRAELVNLALKYRLPGIYWHRDYVEAGGLMSYGPNALEVGRRTAYFVDKILGGANPADLPVEQPTKFELVVNLRTAKALGLTIPQSLLLRVDQVIQ